MPVPSRRDATEVLIETLWNVKTPGFSSLYIENSINRNIVECKE